MSLALLFLLLVLYAQEAGGNKDIWEKGLVKINDNGL